MRRVFKWPVPVDDHWHPIGVGKVVLVDSQFGHNDLLHVWTEEECGPDGKMLHSELVRAAMVIGTGHVVPDLTEHIGSKVAAGGHLVWHVYVGSQELSGLSA